ncbi:MAG: PAS domain-containing protein, partial [Anaerolineales bacterium]
MGKPLRVLIVEDTEDDTRLLLEELKRGGYDPAHERVDTPAAMQRALDGQTWDVVMSDYSMPHFSAPAALALLKERGLDIPFIILSGAFGEELVVAAMNAGANDFIRHENLARLIPAVERELHAAMGRAARKLAEAALRESEAKYRTLADQIPAGIHIMEFTESGSTITASVNPQFERMLGFSAAEWMADPDLWRTQLHPDDRERVLAEAVQLATPGAEPFISEYRMLTRDEHVIWIRDETVVVSDPTGRPRGLQSIRLDITARKQAEAELKEANEKLAGWVKELEQHNQEITLLNELATQLHSCLIAEEAYTAIADYAQLLFPAEAGALYAMSASRASVEAVTAWSEFPASDYVFTPDECWALRRGRLHLVEDPRSAQGQVCQHLGENLTTSYMCVPLMAQGEALGILHLQKRLYRTGPLSKRVGEPLTESKQRLALTVAELIALALANLKLRETLRIQSSRDPLTNLFNRRYLEET